MYPHNEHKDSNHVSPLYIRSIASYVCSGYLICVCVHIRQVYFHMESVLQLKQNRIQIIIFKGAF